MLGFFSSITSTGIVLEQSLFSEHPQWVGIILISLKELRSSDLSRNSRAQWEFGLSHILQNVHFKWKWQGPGISFMILVVQSLDYKGRWKLIDVYMKLHLIQANNFNYHNVSYYGTRIMWCIVMYNWSCNQASVVKQRVFAWWISRERFKI